VFNSDCERPSEIATLPDAKEQPNCSRHVHPRREGHRPAQLIRLGSPITQYRFAGALSQIVMFGQGFSASSGRSSVARPLMRIQGTASSRLPWQRQPCAAPHASVSLRWLRLSRAVALVMISGNGEYEVERLIENTQAKIEQLVENMDAKTRQFTGAPCWMKVGGERDRVADSAYDMPVEYKRKLLLQIPSHHRALASLHGRNHGKMPQATILTAIKFGTPFQVTTINPIEGFGLQLLPLVRR